MSKVNRRWQKLALLKKKMKNKRVPILKFSLFCNHISIKFKKKHIKGSSIWQWSKKWYNMYPAITNKTKCQDNKQFLNFDFHSALFYYNKNNCNVY